jgi:hypothetical protein
VGYIFQYQFRQKRVPRQGEYGARRRQAVVTIAFIHHELPEPASLSEVRRRNQLLLICAAGHFGVQRYKK